MKNIKNISLIFLVFALVAGFFPFLPVPVAKAEFPTETMLSMKVVATAAPVASVRAIQTQPTQAVSTVGSCMADESSTGFLQGATGIVLNQPAECFSLRIAEPVAVSFAIRVQPWEARTTTVRVVSDTHVGTLKTPVPNSAIPATLPVSQSVVMVFALYALSIVVYGYFFKYIPTRTYSLSCVELQVFRC